MDLWFQKTRCLKKISNSNQSSSWNGTIWTFFLGYHLRYIFAKFDHFPHLWFQRRCSKWIVEGWRTTDKSQKLTLVLCARWAKNEASIWVISGDKIICFKNCIYAGEIWHMFFVQNVQVQRSQWFYQNTFESIYTFAMFVKFIINQNNPVSTEKNLLWMKTTTIVPYSLHLLSVQENFNLTYIQSKLLKAAIWQTI